MDSGLKDTVQKILVSVPDYIQKVQCDTNPSVTPFKCAITSCSNVFLKFEDRDKYPYKFHNFPKNPLLCQIWKEHCGLPADADVAELKVCSDHFELDDYVRNYKEEFSNPAFKRNLHSGAVPRKNLQVDLRVKSTDTSNDGLLSFAEIKEVVDENELLKQKYNSLLKKKKDLKMKIVSYENKIKYRVIKTKRLEFQNRHAKGKTDVKAKKNVVRQVFSNAQINLLLGKKRVFWSDDDLAKAFTLRHIGSKECYLYLKNTLNMPLPALACVQKWAASC